MTWSFSSPLVTGRWLSTAGELGGGVGVQSCHTSPPLSSTSHVMSCHVVHAHMPTSLRSCSASRIGESDGNINRKRIKALRQALEKKGWATTGY
jgi:Protein of unknown function (DUF1499)